MSGGDEPVSEHIHFGDSFSDFSLQPAAFSQQPQSSATSTTSAAQQQQDAADNASKYVRDRKIGAGGFGEVYLGHRRDDESQKVAIKVATGEATRELRRECLMLAQLPPDRNVVRVIDVEVVATTAAATSSPASSSNSSGNRLSLVMEFCSRGSLLDLLAAESASSSSSSSFTEERVAAIAAQLLSGLAFIHNVGVAHRDIKLGNALVHDDGTIKIADFGLVGSVTAVGVVGTLNFLAPEAMDGQGEMPADLWAVGCTLSQLALNRSPWHRLRAAAPPTLIGQWQVLREFFRNSSRDELIASIRQELLPPGWSENGVDFFMQLLEPEASRRPTARTLLSHAWLAQFAQSRMQLAEIAQFKSERLERAKANAAESLQPVALMQLARLLTLDEWTEFRGRGECRRSLLQLACEKGSDNDLVYFVSALDLQARYDREVLANSERGNFNRYEVQIIQALRECVRISPNDPFYWTRLAQSSLFGVSFGPNDKREVHILYERALNLDDSLATAWNGCGSHMAKWSPLSTITVRGREYNAQQCLARAAELIVAASAHSGITTSSSASSFLSPDAIDGDSVAFAELQQMMARVSSSSNNSKSSPGSTPSSSISASVASPAAARAVGDSGSSSAATVSGIPAEQPLPIEMVTSVVLKDRPSHFWATLARSYPLRIIISDNENEQKQQQQHSRVACLEKAAEFDPSDSLIAFQLVIALHFDPSSSSDPSRLSTAITRATRAALLDANAHWPLLAWHVAAFFMKICGVESIGDPTVPAGSGSKQLTAEACSRRAVDFVRHLLAEGGTDLPQEMLQSNLAFFGASLMKDDPCALAELCGVQGHEDVGSKLFLMEVAKFPTLAHLLLSPQNLPERIRWPERSPRAVVFPPFPSKDDEEAAESLDEQGRKKKKEPRQLPPSTLLPLTGRRFWVEVAFPLLHYLLRLDIADRKLYQGAPLQIYRRNGTEAQQFFFLRVPSSPHLLYIVPNLCVPQTVLDNEAQDDDDGGGNNIDLDSNILVATWSAPLEALTLQPLSRDPEQAKRQQWRFLISKMEEVHAGEELSGQLATADLSMVVAPADCSHLKGTNLVTWPAFSHPASTIMIRHMSQWIDHEMKQLFTGKKK